MENGVVQKDVRKDIACLGTDEASLKPRKV